MKHLRNFTSARVDLGRAGNSVPLREMLQFQLAHAKARDAVHFPLDPNVVPGTVVHSAAKDRTEYLRRPDLGRRLDPACRPAIESLRGEFDAAFVVADGLSALAIHRNAPALLEALKPRLENWRIAPTVVVEQGRVAIGDEIGELLGAAMVIVLIGERPGLSSPDSLGAYLTYGPKPGRTDAERNCISNIRPEGLSPGAAAEFLVLLMNTARSRRISGVDSLIWSGGSRKDIAP